MSRPPEHTGVVIAASTAIVTLAVTVAPWVMARNQLPDPIAIHWGTTGVPNGSAPCWVGLAAPLALWAAAWLPWLTLRRRARDAAWLLPSGVGLSVFVAAISWLTVDANRHAGTWTDAGHLSMTAGIVALAAAFIAAAATMPVAHHLSPTTPKDASSQEWHQRTWSGALVLALAGSLLAVVLAGVASGMQLYVVGVLVVVGSAAAVLIRTTVSVDDAGFVVSFGPWGWPQRRVPLENIAHATTVDVQPARYGGWGYRRRREQTAIVLRAGTGIEVVTHTGRNLVVTVDHADVGAARINDRLRATGRLCHVDGDLRG